MNFISKLIKSGTTFLSTDSTGQKSVDINPDSNDIDLNINMVSANAVSMDAATGKVTIAQLLSPKALAGNGVQTEDAGSATSDELVVTGDFSSDPGGWTKTGGTISGGQGVLTNDSAFLSQVIATLTEGKTYNISYTVIDNDVRISIAGSTTPYDQTKTPGSYAESFVMGGPGSTPTLWLQGAAAGGTSKIDDVSIQEDVSVTITPTNFAIEVTNSEAYTNPEITLASGSLPVNSIICVTCIADVGDNCNLKINSTGPSIELSATANEGALFTKTSIGWLPLSGNVEPS